MFTGIVAAVGSIQTLTPLGANADAGLRLAIDAGGLPLTDVAIGDSIAVNGACMTVVAKTDARFEVDVSRESLNRTAGLDGPGEVNLEKALTLADRLGGHLVSGHVDGLGTVRRFEPVGESWELVVEAPRELGKYRRLQGLYRRQWRVADREPGRRHRQRLQVFHQPDSPHDTGHHA